jgi:hypothetical protein
VQYIRPFTYFLNKSAGSTNLMYGSLALLTGLVIPIVGQLVVLGYAAEVAEDLEHDPELTDHRNFKTEKLVDYLVRGIWPFLMQVVLFVLFLIYFAVVVGLGIGVYVYTGDPPIAGIVAGVVFLPGLLILTLTVWPMTLYAQLSRGFYPVAAFRFTISFLRRVGIPLALALVFSSFVSFWLALFGLMLCIVGVYPAIMIQVMAQEHYTIQLYRLYLDEGGERIPIPGETDALDDFEGDDEERSPRRKRLR